MSLENVEVYTNFASWRVVQLTLTGTLTSLADLLPTADQAIVNRPICRVELTAGAAVNVSSAASGHATRVLTADQTHVLPLINPLRKVWVSGSGNLTLTVYFSG